MPTAFHINEGRWLRDNCYVDDYINSCIRAEMTGTSANQSPPAVYARYLANGDRAFAIKNLGFHAAYLSALDKSLRPVQRPLFHRARSSTPPSIAIASIDASGGRTVFSTATRFVRRSIASCSPMQ